MRVTSTLKPDDMEKAWQNQTPVQVSAHDEHSGEGTYLFLIEEKPIHNGTLWTYSGSGCEVQDGQQGEWSPAMITIVQSQQVADSYIVRMAMGIPSPL
jgi:hypothetical protein